MGDWPVQPGIPRPIPPFRFARNGSLVQAQYYRMLAAAQNHILAHRRKWFGTFSYGNYRNGSGAAGTSSLWRTYIRTGHHIQKLRAEIVFARPKNSAAVNPIIYFSTINPTTLAVIETSTVLQCGPVDTGTSDAPDTLGVGYCELDTISDDTAYGIQVYAGDYARPVSCCLYELGTTDGTVDDTVTGAVDPRFSVGGNIWDAQWLAMAQGQTEMIRTNRPHSIMWAHYDGVGTVVAGNVYTNVLDGSSTTVTAATPGWYLENQYHNTFSRTTVPVVFAVYGARTVGLNQSYAQLTDGTNTITIGGITSTAGWYTQTGTISAAAATKFDVHCKNSDAGGSTRIDAVALLEYE